MLLVEDEDGLRRLVARVLRGLGYQVIEADNGHAALRAWQQHPGTINLLFSDMTMPGGLTGLDLAAQLRIQQPALKVIISSGYSPQTPGIAKLESTAITFLQKPYEPAVLARAVRQCLAPG